MRQAGAVTRFVAAALAVVSAVWLRPASMHIVGWRGSHAEIVAFTPPASQLWGALAVASILLALLLLIGRRRSASAEQFARGLAPLYLLFAWAVPYVPGVATAFPLLLVLAGPLRWAIAVAGLGGSLWTLWNADTSHWSIRPLSTRAVFLWTLAIYVTLGWYVSRQIGPTGDEPQYLVLAHSLLVDRDIEIGNNFEARDYKAFYRAPLEPHRAAPGPHGEVYTFHAPGVAAIVLPGYVLGGYRGAVLTIALLAALTAAITYRTAAQVAGGPAAMLAWVATAFTIPFAPYGWSIYPETPAALITALAVWWMWAPPAGWRTWIVRGAVLAVFPWLHLKFGLLLVCLTICLAIRLRRQIIALAALVTPLALSVLLWLFSFYVRYGVFNPVRPYQRSESVGGGIVVNAGGIVRAVLGLSFDRAFGVLPYSPVFAFILIGLWYLLKRRETRALGVRIGVTLATVVFTASRTFGWWGSFSPPGRFVVPAVPLAAVMLGAAFREIVSPFWRTVLLAAMAVSLANLAALTAVPSMHLLYNNWRSAGRLLETLQGEAPLSFVLPTFVEARWQPSIPSLAVMLAAVIAGLILARLHWMHSPDAGSHGLRIPVTILTVFLLVESVFAARLLSRSEKDDAAWDGRVGLLDRYDGSRLIARDAETMRPLSDADVLDRGRIAVERPWPAIDNDAASREVTATLPAGTYQARVWFAHAPSRRGEFLATDRRTRNLLARERGILSNPATVNFEFGSTSSVVFFVRDESLRADVVRLEIQPLAIVPRSRRTSP